MNRHATPLPPIFRLLSVAILVVAAFAVGYWVGDKEPESSVFASDRTRAEPESIAAARESEPSRHQPPAREASAINVDEPLQPKTAPAPAPKTDDLLDQLDPSLSPREALAYVARQPISEQEKQKLLKGLAARWIAKGQQLSEEELLRWQRRINAVSGARYGLEVELGMMLAEAKVSPEVAHAWMDAHASHPGRSQLFASLLAEQFKEDPISVLQASNSWTDWEESRFEKNLLQNWARSDPRSAYDWYAQHSTLFDAQAGSDILNTISRSDPRLASELLVRIQNSDQRATLVESVASDLAKLGTAQAIEWADSLPTEGEREAALEAIYHATPQGVGAMLARQDGYPHIQQLVSGGPLESSGLAPGDLIVQTREAGGPPTDLYGMHMGEIVQTLRGAPGSEVTVSALRRNAQTGEWEQVEAVVNRDVLIIPPSSDP